MLFISFEKPHRLRLQGLASVDDGDPLLPQYPEAQLIVRVTVTEIFRNCPRYVHQYKKTKSSEFVPRSTGQTPLRHGSASTISRRLCRSEIVPASNARAA
jgi:uncharacterized protein